MNQKKEAIYDARELGVPKMLLLGLQHMFAMCNYLSTNSGKYLF